MTASFVIAVLSSAVISYLLGGINSAIITVRIFEGQDIRDFGSKNAGLTNTLRCFGKKCALMTLVGDILKGVIAVLLCKLICIWLGVGLGENNETQFIGYIAGFFAVIGHIFPVYYGFKGGKGVLVGVSVFIVIDPIVFGILIGIFALILALSRYVSLSSMISASLCPFITFAVQYLILSRSWQLSLLYAAMTLPICAVIIIMHRSNIQRLRSGTENRFSFSKKEE